eukprot:scaffold21871_cov64-Phaeocystis_antarctica.AAC.8
MAPFSSAGSLDAMSARQASSSGRSALPTSSTPSHSHPICLHVYGGWRGRSPSLGRSLELRKHSRHSVQIR